MTSTIKRNMTRIVNGDFVKVDVELRDRTGQGLELSICGVAGYVTTPAQAKREALEFWASYFDELLDDECVLQFHKLKCRTSTGAARRVVNCDGKYHGLNVVAEIGNGRKAQVLIGHSFGQIREDIVKLFPEVAPYFQWHLNSMHSECEHQEARGEKYDHADDGMVTVCSECDKERTPEGCKCEKRMVANAWGADHNVLPPTKERPKHKCPDCGWVLGHGWSHRPLPDKVVEWATNFGQED